MACSGSALERHLVVVPEYVQDPCKHNSLVSSLFFNKQSRLTQMWMYVC